ncbi:hypothetical protein CCHL11_02900 [Colletotrichum chlorophyti]|uniref:F-box domain-containing protein n=1 Tax=Colletotrichum chlorophyti TaxID=708187 RepID=A0A1Q8S0Y6_9PEZI|nr:hypothetical protein CCHL11_02900 [Colletotrichum chlorophyti]
MDPPHITEFASERYFNKLNQLSESPNSRDAYHPHQLRDPHLPLSQPFLPQPTPSQSSSTFILPLRSSLKSNEPDVEPIRLDQKRSEKSRLFGLRSKVSILHPKPATQCGLHEQNVGTLKPKTASFGQLFLALPTELQIQIISSLPLTDVLNLRRVSRAWHAVVMLNEAPIVRYHLDCHIPAYALRLYPSTDPTTANFHHLCGLWHRLHVAAKLSFLMCEWITKEIFLRTTEAQRIEFAPQHERMRRRLIPLLFTVFHFFETYRRLHLQYISEHGYGLQQEPYTTNPIEVQIMNMYDDETLLRVHQVFPLVISSFCRRLRPPSYAGRVERSLRGYLKEKPADEVHVAILCIGGLRQVERLWEIKGYNSRRGAVDTWYNSVTRDPVEPAASKSRRGIMGLGRKKSALSIKEPSKTTFQEGLYARRGSRTSFDDNIEFDEANLVFNTSLAAGMPMGPLGRDHLRRLLADLPNLQDIWLKTAEAMILDRGVVERTQDIKRNAQVMLELIREDGIDEEDEWWYGRTTPESVRPPLEAIEEDPIEGI